MDLLNLDINQYRPLVIEAFTHVYGEKYREIIEDKINRSIVIKYIDTGGISSYIYKLKEIKSYHLALSFLKQIGYDTTKYEKKNNIELINDHELYSLCYKYLGSLNKCFKDDKCAIIRMINPDNYFFITLINEMYKKEEITEDNFEQFKETEDYKDILEKIKGYNKIYDELIEEYKKYENTLSSYQNYIDSDKKRKNEIYDKGIDRVIKRIYPLLPKFLKDKFDESTKEQIKKLLFITLVNNDFTGELSLDYFNENNMNELYSDETRKYKKWIIADFQTSYFKNFNIDLPNKDTLKFDKDADVTTYLNFLQQEDVKNLIPSQEIIDKIHKICEEEASNCLREYYIESNNFKNIINEYNMNESHYELLLTVFKNSSVCITWGGGYVDNRYSSVMFYTIRRYDLGVLSYSYLHELGHVVDDNENMPSGLDDDESKNPYDNSKRKYEVINETVNDMFTMEATDFLHNQNIYILEPEENTISDISDFNTSSLTKSILVPLLNSYREYVVEAKINSDQSILSDYIGEKNFEALNDIVNRVEYLARKGLKYKLEDNEKCDEVTEYYVLLDKAKLVYNKIEEYVAKNFPTSQSHYY